MIWFNLKKLEENISDDNLSDKDGLNYLIAYFVLITITGYTGHQEMPGWLLLLGVAAQVIIMIWGLNAIYKINLEIDGKDFFKRFFAINWVIGIRVLVGVFLLFIIIRIGIGSLSENSSELSPEANPIVAYFLVIFSTLFSIIIYLLIMNSFRNLKPKA